MGMSGEYAFAKYIGELDDFLAFRYMKDIDPYTGDGGADFVINGQEIDVKSSWQYNESVPLERMRMLIPNVRPLIYVYALLTNKGEAVHLMGWKQHHQLCYRGEYYDCPADLLNRLPEKGEDFLK